MEEADRHLMSSLFCVERRRIVRWDASGWFDEWFGFATGESGSGILDG